MFWVRRVYHKIRGTVEKVAQAAPPEYNVEALVTKFNRLVDEHNGWRMQYLKKKWPEKFRAGYDNSKFMASQLRDKIDRLELEYPGMEMLGGQWIICWANASQYKQGGITGESLSIMVTMLEQETLRDKRYAEEYQP